MTEQEWIDLGRRAVACKGWRWMPGMYDILTDLRCVAFFDDDESSSWADTGPEAKYQTGRAHAFSAVPDLRDPATLGCLLELVREAWGSAKGDDPALVTHQGQSDKWGVGAWVFEHGHWYFAAIVLPACATEAEALVCALEAAL